MYVNYCHVAILTVIITMLYFMFINYIIITVIYKNIFLGYSGNFCYGRIAVYLSAKLRLLTYY